MTAKRAFVTGASEGIGRSLCAKLVKEGWHVVGLARSKDRLASLQQELGEAFTFEVADLAEISEIDRVAELVRAGQFELLVNNAGFGVYGTFSELPLERYRNMLRVNVEALVVLSHAYLSNARSGDALINLSSVLAFLPMPTGGLYSATKALVTSFSESLWFQAKDKGVYVMNFCPGPTETQFHERTGGQTKKMPAFMMQTSEEVAERIYAGLVARKRPTIISGSKNTLMSSMHRYMSRKGLVQTLGKRV